MNSKSYCGQTKITFTALFFNIILFYIFFRRDHIREEQSLRICQGHPNIVKLQEVFQDAVSALCKVMQSRILNIWFCYNNAFNQFIWWKANIIRLIVVFLPANGQLSWALANNLHTLQCVLSMFFHAPFFIGLPMRGNIQLRKWEANWPRQC